MSDDPEARPAPSESKAWVTLLLVALAIGVIDAVLFVVFEAVVDDGSDWVWNDLAGTDEVRWRVVPLAIVLSIAFSFVVRLCGQPRSTEPKTDLLEEVTGGRDASPATLSSIAIIFVIGATSLVAGASLGPEASLVLLTAGVGSLLGARARAGTATGVLVLSSIGALLVAFLGSLIPVLLPVLLLRKQGHASLRNISIAVVSGVAAYVTLFAIQGGSADGYGTVPASDSTWHDLVAAAVVGFVVVFVAHGFLWLIRRLVPVTKRLDVRLPWPVAAAVFGTGLGLAYLVGGQTIEFSGSAGSALLLQRASTYSTIAIGGLVLAKLVATAWSLSAGYRGGTVFPSIYMAVATGLFVSRIDTALAGPGVVVGVVAGMLTALVGPAGAVIFIVSIVPAKAIVLAVIGVAAAMICDRLLKKLPNSG